MRADRAAVAILGALALAACFPFGDSKPSQGQPTKGQPGSTTLTGSSQGEASAAPETAAPPPVVPAGTELRVALARPLRSDKNDPGDTVTATLTRDVEVEGRVVLEKGTRLRGHVTDVRSAGRIKGRARLGFVFERLVLTDGTERPIKTASFFFEGGGKGKRDAAMVGGGAGLGGIIGGIAGGKKGAALGVAVGAGAGGGAVLATRGKQVQLDAGAVLEVRLKADLVLD